MKLFVDTANKQEISKAFEYGFLSGVTTNPSLVARGGGDFRNLIKEIASIVEGPVNAEVLTTDAAGMVAEAVCCQTAQAQRPSARASKKE